MSNPQIQIGGKIYRNWKTYLGVVLMLFIFTASYAFGGEVLVVVGKKNLKATDRAIKSNLKKRGFKVIIAEGKRVKREDALDKDLVIVSDTIVAGNVNSKFRDIAIPIINAEPWLLDDFGMTAKTKLTDFGRKTRQQNIKIINPEHPLASSFSGDVQVSSKGFFMGWGVPGENAIKVATMEKNPNKYTLFAYDAGADMPGCVAPARRVGFFLYRGTEKSITDDGWSLFNAAVDWAISEPKASIRAEKKSTNIEKLRSMN